MKSTEFITEKIIQTWTEGTAFRVNIDDHVMYQMSREECNGFSATWSNINKIFKRIKNFKPQIRQMIDFDRFWLRDENTGVELGCKYYSRDTEEILLIKTMTCNINFRENAENPIIIVNEYKPTHKEFN